MPVKSNRQGLALLTLNEVGQAMGISKQAVSIIEARALRKMRARLLVVLQEHFGKLDANPHTAALTHARLVRESMHRTRSKATKQALSLKERPVPKGPKEPASKQPNRAASEAA